MKSLVALLVATLCLLLLSTSCVVFAIAAEKSLQTNQNIKGDTTGHCPTCNTRGMIEDLKRELMDLKCTQSRFKGSLKAMKTIKHQSTQQATSLRSKYLDEVDQSIAVLTEELEALTWKCTRFLGEDCDGACAQGFGGEDCDKVVGSTPLRVQSLDHVDFSSLFVKNISLVNDAKVGFKYMDGTMAKSCKDYRNPSSGYVYSNEGSGKYLIQPGKTPMTVYCDMETDGGGWTLFAGLRFNYSGEHMHVFDDNSAVESSGISSFHIKTQDLMPISKELRAATDRDSVVVDSLFTSKWPFSASCEIPDAFRSDVDYTRSVPYSKLSGFLVQERAAKCKDLTGNIPYIPTHITYSRTGNKHSIGFRMGIPRSDITSHFTRGKTVFSTYSFKGAPEGETSDRPDYYPGTTYTIDESYFRNCALFLR